MYKDKRNENTVRDKYIDFIENNGKTLISIVGAKKQLILNEVAGLVDKSGIELLRSMTGDEAGTALVAYIIENRELADEFCMVFDSLNLTEVANIIRQANEADFNRRQTERIGYKLTFGELMPSYAIPLALSISVVCRLSCVVCVLHNYQK